MLSGCQSPLFYPCDGLDLLARHFGGERESLPLDCLPRKAEKGEPLKICLDGHPLDSRQFTLFKETNRD